MYWYYSTTGSLNDLSYGTYYEILTYGDGSTNPYNPPAPFNPFNYQNPTKYPSAGVSLANGLILDTQYQWPTTAPYSDQSFNVGQTYDYDDPFLGTTKNLIPGSNNANTITRHVFLSSPQGGTWFESVTKSGVVGVAQLN